MRVQTLADASDLFRCVSRRAVSLLRTILTIDHNDFETYRIGRNAEFRIIPAR